MRTNSPSTNCPIRTCPTVAVVDAAANGAVEIATSTLLGFPPDRWVTVTPLCPLPNAQLVVELHGETDAGPIVALVTATQDWFHTQPLLVTVHHNLGQLVAASLDTALEDLAPEMSQQDQLTACERPPLDTYDDDPFGEVA